MQPPESPSKHLITVVIPTHDRADWLTDAIESVLSSPLIESPEQIIVVDDDSHDRTPDVARAFGVTYMRVECHGAAGSRNAGLGRASTPYVAFLDDDDLWLAGNMEAQLAALQANPDAGFAYGLCRFVTDDLEPLAGPCPTPPLLSGFVPDRLHLSYPQIGVVLFRRDVLVAVGGFDLAIRYYEDADLMLRIAARQEIVGVDTVGLLYRERFPSKQRCDYFWGEARREVTRWRPDGLGVTRWTAQKFRFRTKGLFCWRFCLDAAASVEAGRSRDALVCLWRAVRISPAHALRQSRVIGAILRRCLTADRREAAVADGH